jgi:DNA-binding MarR family transcriptional regulator
MQKPASAPAEAASADPHPPNENSRSEQNQTSYTLSEVVETGLKRLAARAPKMRERELRVLLYLESITEQGPPHATRASLREIAKATGLAISNVQAAIVELGQKDHISRVPGTATKPSFIHVHTHSVIQTGVPITGTPKKGTPPKGCEQERYTAYLFQDEGAPITGTPPDENAALPAAAPRVDLDSDFKSLIDRVLSAKPKNQNPNEMAAARKWMHGYATKFPSPDNQKPHPPDETACAQLLAVAPWPRIERMFYDLTAERQTAGYNWAWFVVVALQRIHGISATKQKQTREQLKLIGRQKGKIPDPQFTAALVDELAAASRRVK